MAYNYYTIPENCRLTNQNHQELMEIAKGFGVKSFRPIGTSRHRPELSERESRFSQTHHLIVCL